MLLLLIIYFIPISLSKEARIKKISFSEEINLIITSTSSKSLKILNSQFTNVYQIEINGKSVDYINTNSYTFDSGDSNVKLIFDSKINNCEKMFSSCAYIKYIDLSNFDTSLCINMNSMFSGCTKLTSINLNNFNTSSVLDMKSMFNKCSTIKTIDLSSFNTSSVKTFNNMFNGFSNLKKLNLSGFDTSQITDINNMFYSCNELISLDLSSWVCPKLESMVNTFQGCSKLISLDFSNFDFKSLTKASNTFYNANTNIIYCLYQETNNLANTIYESWKRSIKTPSCQNDCFKNKNNIFVIINNNPGICLQKCNYEDYNYEYDIECLQTYPEGTQKSLNNEFLCIDVLNCPNFYNYDQTECIDQLNDGYYILDNEKKIIDKCDNKCKKCTLESTKENSCTECNTEGNYYQIYDKENTAFFKCIKEMPEGYFFSDNKYIPCYESCLKCDGEGDNNNHHCTECLSDLILIENNCYQKCAYLYYFNEKKEYVCTDNDQCPANYKLIKNKKKCIDKCSNDKDFQYEYNDECYEDCPSGSHHNDDNICIMDLECDNFYNYEHTGCIDKIPEGFYCNDISKKTIDKCNIKCKQCSLESVQKDLCILCNNVEGYYQKYNDNKNIDEYINCYKDITEGYYLYTKDNIYMQCYKTCKTCSETGTIMNHKCSSCYSNSTLNGSNCYE